MKKAIILAGGRGTRLSPLTDGLPKPLVPFLGKTLLERIIEKLTRSGIEKIMITTAYLSDMIKNKIGMHYGGAVIEYLEEKVPLGTAGGLSFAREILSLSEDEDFVVISGDCVCDFDLLKAQKAHKLHSACATVITTECENPLEYGVVLSKSGGIITSFNEKPCWSQVGGCRVNTGVYILSSSVTQLVPKNAQYDFSHDLFPDMLEKGLRLYEHCDNGYWCDVGSIESYYKCCIDALSGKIGNFDSENKAFCQLDGIKITHPCYIPHNVQIEKGAEIGPNVILSSRCFVGKNSEIVGSIIHSGVRICENSRVEGAVVCENAEIGRRASVCGGSVIAKGVKIPQCAYLKSGSVIRENPKENEVFHFDNAGNLFELEEGIFLATKENAESADCARVGYVLSKTMGANAKIGLMHDGTDGAKSCFSSLTAGMERGSCFIFDYGEGFESLARAESVFFSTDCFVYLYTDSESDVIFAKLFNKNGLAPSRDFERRFCTNMQNLNDEKVEQCRKYKAEMKDATARYFALICDNFKSFCGCDGLYGARLAFENDTCEEMKLLKEAFLLLGGQSVDKKDAQETSVPIIKRTDEGVVISQGNYTLDRYHAICAIFSYDKERDGVALPYLSPEAYKSLLKRKVLYYPEHSARRFSIPEGLLKSCYYLRDDILLFARFVSLLFKSKKNISEFYFELPLFGFSERIVRLPNGYSKTLVIKKLSDKCRVQGVCDSFEGIKLSYPEGNVTVVPGKAQLFKIYSESRSAEIASNLCESVEKEILEREK